MAEISSKRDAILQQLAAYESPNVTYLPESPHWPIVWERAKGMDVWDVAGKHYLDFTAAFGVAAAGHAAPAVVRAGRAQMGQLLHAMGDVHPHPLKARLAERLSQLTFGRWLAGNPPGQGKVVFCNSGFETVEVALKTACQATGRRRIVSFTDAYHGLGYGALVATHRPYFRGGFGQQLSDFAQAVPFPRSKRDLARSREIVTTELQSREIGAVLVEPLQGRGGIQVPHEGFLRCLRELCDEFGAVLILDEIFTGFGRTGRWFACEHESVIPDLICLGKALTGGFPLSAMVGRADLMDRAWPKSPGEAIHTSTYLGHPVGCAMALAQLELLEKRRLPARSDRQGRRLLRLLRRVFPERDRRVVVRGKGLMVGVEFLTADGQPDAAVSLSLIETLLDDGFVLLPDGEHGHVIGITPPLIVTNEQLDAFVECLHRRYLERSRG